MSFWDKKEAKKLFQELPFYNVLTEKPKNMELLHELPFFDELNVVEYQKYLKDMLAVIKLK